MDKFLRRYDFSFEYLQFMKEQYAVNTKIVSPSGKEGTVFCFTHAGFLISTGDGMKEVTFDQIGYYKIIQ